MKILNLTNFNWACKDPKICSTSPLRIMGCAFQIWPKPIKFVSRGKKQQWALPEDSYREESSLYLGTNECQALHNCSRGGWVCKKSRTVHSLLPMLFLLFLFSFFPIPFSNVLSFPYIPIPPSHLHHSFLPNLLPFLTLVTFHIWRRWWKKFA